MQSDLTVFARHVHTVTRRERKERALASENFAHVDPLIVDSPDFTGRLLVR